MGNRFVLHSGPFGCGKTYSLVEGFGLYCLALKSRGIENLNFILLGKTQQAVKKNMCNVLSKLFGQDFKYDTSRKSGIVKDARLFNQNIYIIGLNDASSESKFRGISDIMGILHDEAQLCKRDQFEYIMGRLRGEIQTQIPDEFYQHWYIGSTNPDAPNHFLLQFISSGFLKRVDWYMRDAEWVGAREYYSNLMNLYRDNEQFYNRYLLGQWTAADRMVYSMFNPKQQVVQAQEVDVDYLNMNKVIVQVDYGSDHPTAILLICINYSGQFIIAKEYTYRNTAPQDLVQSIIDIHRYVSEQTAGVRQVDTIIIDPSARALKDELTKHGLSYTNALNQHIDGIGFVQQLFSTNRLFILDTCKNLISELYNYRYKDNSQGKDEVYKVGDDLVDSLRYGCYTSNKLYLSNN